MKTIKAEGDRLYMLNERSDWVPFYWKGWIKIKTGFEPFSIAAGIFSAVVAVSAVVAATKMGWLK